MALIDKVTAHYKEISGVMREVEVPEWDVVIYSKPLTLFEIKQIDAAPSDYERVVDLLILKALDANGENVFGKEHKQQLLRSSDSKVLSRVAEQIADGMARQVDMEGN